MCSDANTQRVPYIHPEFDHFWETRFGESDPTFLQCDVHRPSGGDPGRLMGIMNHFHSIPLEIHPVVLPPIRIPGAVMADRWGADTFNTAQSIWKQGSICVEQHGMGPNVILVRLLPDDTPCLHLALPNRMADSFVSYRQLDYVRKGAAPPLFERLNNLDRR